MDLAVRHVANKDTVFIVARKADHVTELQDLLIARGVAYNDIYCVSHRKDAITLSENAINSKAENKDTRIRRYKVVICSIATNTGFSMQICNVQISTVYMSNAASREQIKCRIKRLGSSFKEVRYVSVVCGRIQQLIAFRYDRDDSLASILKDLAFGDVSLPIA